MKYIAHVFLILVGLGAAFLRWIDLVNFIDLDTGFVAVGSVWWRYGAIALLVLLSIAGSFMAAKRPAGIERGSAAAGGVVFAVAVLCAVQNAVDATLGLNFAALAQGSAGSWRAGIDAAAVGIALLGLVCAAWLFSGALSLFGGSYRLPAGGVALGMLGNLYLYALLISRFSANQSSYHRLDPTVSVFAAAAAIWFTSALLRAVYYPQSAIGRKLYAAGLACFYLCTCFALPQGICDMMVGNITFGALGEVILFAGFGVLGAVYATRALGKDIAE